MSFKEKYHENLSKIKSLQDENYQIILGVIYDFLQKNVNNIFVLRNVSVNQIVLSAKIPALNQIIFDLTQEKKTRYKDKDLIFYFEENAIYVHCLKKEAGYDFIHKYHVVLKKNQTAIEMAGFDHAVKNYDELFDYLIGK